MSFKQTIPFRTFLWKIASRCNLNCTYCYVYNQGDTTWESQPAFMSHATATQAARRMREHAQRTSTASIDVIFHGGEPLLGGVRHLEMLVNVLKGVFADSGVSIQLGVQSNGTLVTEEIAEFLKEHAISIGISVDGPPHLNDIHRIDLLGLGSSARVEHAIEILSASRYAAIFGGLLCVVNLNHDPIEVVDYLLSWGPRQCDLLLPLANHDRRPAGKERDIAATPYGDWLVAAFDRWMNVGNGTRIRFFESVIRRLMGVGSLVESIGLGEIAIVVVEANGHIEALDALKASYDGGAATPYDVFGDSFDEIAHDHRIRIRQVGADGLSDQCQRCELLQPCGGGYLPHRYSSAQGYMNPSVYCSDLMRLLYHVNECLRETLSATRHRAAT
jgi:uncharacterized protein